MACQRHVQRISHSTDSSCRPRLHSLFVITVTLAGLPLLGITHVTYCQCAIQRSKQEPSRGQGGLKGLPLAEVLSARALTCLGTPILALTRAFFTPPGTSTSSVGRLTLSRASRTAFTEATCSMHQAQELSWMWHKHNRGCHLQGGA